MRLSFLYTLQRLDFVLLRIILSMAQNMSGCVLVLAPMPPSHVQIIRVFPWLDRVWLVQEVASGKSLTNRVAVFSPANLRRFLLCRWVVAVATKLFKVQCIEIVTTQLLSNQVPPNFCYLCDCSGLWLKYAQWLLCLCFVKWWRLSFLTTSLW